MFFFFKNMEISASIRDVVTSTREYVGQPSEANLTKLQRCLDAVNGLVSRDSSGAVFKGEFRVDVPLQGYFFLFLKNLTHSSCERFPIFIPPSNSPRPAFDARRGMPLRRFLSLRFRRARPRFFSHASAAVLGAARPRRRNSPGVENPL